MSHSWRAFEQLWEAAVRMWACHPCVWSLLSSEQPQSSLIFLLTFEWSSRGTSWLSRSFEPHLDPDFGVGSLYCGTEWRMPRLWLSVPPLVEDYVRLGSASRARFPFCTANDPLCHVANWIDSCYLQTLEVLEGQRPCVIQSFFG